MRKILAISGGVDSMVMLDLLYHSSANAPDDLLGNELIIAHYDHGTRPSSKTDASFVMQAGSEKYKIPTFTTTDELGENVPEEIARKYRYDYLRHLAINLTPPQQAYISAHQPGQPRVGLACPILEIYTAHHLDDLVESIAINLLRGTGWRGLAVLDTPGIVRPFLEPSLLGASRPWNKRDVLKYAAQHNITFRQDPTNCEDHYLRNRVRQKLKDFHQEVELYKLWQRQKELKQEIDQLIGAILPISGTPWQRSWFRDLDKSVALELLRAGTLQAGISATRPQLENFRQAILHYAPGTYFNLPGDRLIKLNKDSFVL